jgi:hypothetical protein
MKIAAFNVENLFDRPIAFNLHDHEQGTAITEAVAELNVLIGKEDYSASDKARMLELIDFLELTKPRPPFAIFRKKSGVPCGKSRATRPCRSLPTVAATGWVGWSLALKPTMPSP